jgi:hypothetical protein
MISEEKEKAILSIVEAKIGVNIKVAALMALMAGETKRATASGVRSLFEGLVFAANQSGATAVMYAMLVVQMNREERLGRRVCTQISNDSGDVSLNMVLSLQGYLSWVCLLQRVYVVGWENTTDPQILVFGNIDEYDGWRRG